MGKKHTNELDKALENKDFEILDALLVRYSGLLLHHSNQIWSIGSVFIPLSLTGAALGLEDPFRTLIVGIFSICLIWIWYFISANLRSLIDQTWQICATIESAILKLNPPRRITGISEYIPVNSLLRLKTIRLLIPITISILWVSGIVLSFYLKP